MSTLEAGKNPHDIILKPVVTGKPSIFMDEDKYTFGVSPHVNKTKIKIAIETIFGVRVGQAATRNCKGKTHRTRVGQDKRKDVKCAIVTLRGGTIDIFGDQT